MIDNNTNNQSHIHQTSVDSAQQAKEYPTLKFANRNEILKGLQPNEFFISHDPDKNICVAVKTAEGPRQYTYLKGTAGGFLYSDGQEKPLHEIVDQFAQKGLKEQDVNSSLPPSPRSAESPPRSPPTTPPIQPANTSSADTQNGDIPNYLPAHICKITTPVGWVYAGQVELTIGKEKHVLMCASSISRGNYQPLHVINEQGKKQTVYVSAEELQTILKTSGEAFPIGASIEEQLKVITENKKLQIRAEKGLQALDQKVRQLQQRFCLTEKQTMNLRSLLAIPQRKDPEFEQRMNFTNPNAGLDALEKWVDDHQTLPVDSKNTIKQEINALRADIKLNVLFNNVQSRIVKELSIAFASEKITLGEVDSTVVKAFHFRSTEYFAENFVQDDGKKIEGKTDQEIQDMITEGLEQIRADIKTAWSNQVQRLEKPTPKELCEELQIPRNFTLLPGFSWKDESGYVFARNQTYSNSQDNYLVPFSESISIFNRRKAAEQLSPLHVTTMASEYKIHLMPKTEHMEEMLDKLQNKLRAEPALKKLIKAYKVLTGTVPADGKPATLRLDAKGKPLPKIVIYTTNKDEAQKLINVIHELFKDDVEKGEGQTPRLNEKLNDLVYYAQGSADLKYAAQEQGIAADLFEGDSEEGLVHFKSNIRMKHWPKEAEVNGDYRLRLPE